MRILFLDSTHPLLPKLLEEQGHHCDLLYNLSEAELRAKMSEYEGWVIRSRFKLDKKTLDLGEKLKFIARVGAGMENIDVEYAEGKGIYCLHAPQGNANAVAEHALGMLLNLLRNINRANDEVKGGVWKREENRGVEVDGKVVGVVGYGNMGKAFVKKLKGFDVEVLVYDKYFSGFGDEFVSEVSLDELFLRTDILSLHLPQTEETIGLINDTYINSFKKPFYIINTARGSILRTEALAKAIESGKVLGACLDVLEYESASFENLGAKSMPKPFSYLINSDKVLLSPHIAGWTHESNIKMAKILAKKIGDLNLNE